MDWSGFLRRSQVGATQWGQGGLCLEPKALSVLVLLSTQSL